MNRLALLLIPLTLWPSPVTALELPIVAILDSGINGLPCAANFSSSPDFDSNGHGSKMAVIIGRADCRILNVKVADDKGLVWPSALTKGIYWAVAHGASHINISVTLPADETGVVAEAVQYALNRGVVIVAAQRGDIPSYPAAYEGVISVWADGEFCASEATAYRTFFEVQK